MRAVRRLNWARGMGKARRPLVACLLAALLFELSLLAGVLASPFLQDWMPRRGLPMDDTTAKLVRYRRSVAHGECDPHLGEPAPPLALRTLGGQPLDPAVFRGKKVALLFLRDGSG
jgi:hypothetical protein